MSITLYFAPWSSASPVVSALAELEVPHETVQFDLSKTEHKKPEFLALNPNGAVPTLVVDGTPMFEALAIMQWLGDRYGVAKGLWPAADAPERLTAMAWSTWAYVTYGPVVHRLVLATSTRRPELKNEAHFAAAQADAKRLLGILDERLGKQSYLLGADYSLADLIVSAVVGYAAHVGATFEAFDNVVGWMKRVGARPAVANVN